MCKIKHFCLFCKSCFVLFLTFTIVLRYYPAPPQILGIFYVKIGIFGTVLGILKLHL